MCDKSLPSPTQGGKKQSRRPFAAHGPLPGCPGALFSGPGAPTAHPAAGPVRLIPVCWIGSVFFSSPRHCEQQSVTQWTPTPAPFFDQRSATSTTCLQQQRARNASPNQEWRASKKKRRRGRRSEVSCLHRIRCACSKPPAPLSAVPTQRPPRALCAFSLPVLHTPRRLWLDLGPAAFRRCPLFSRVKQSECAQSPTTPTTHIQ